MRQSIGYLKGSKAVLTYRTSGMQSIFWKVVREVGVDASATLFALGHSFATHLLVTNVDLRYR